MEELNQTEHKKPRRKRHRPEGIMSISEVAEYTGLPKSTMYKFAKQGKIPCRKLSNYWEFNKQEIDVWKRQEESEKNQANPQNFENLIVKSIISRGHLKEVKFIESKIELILPRSACVAKNDQVKLGESSASVICKNGLAHLFPSYAKLETLQVGGLELQFLIKEVTELEEFDAYQALTEQHYRSRTPYGRKATLIVRNFHPNLSQSNWLY